MTGVDRIDAVCNRDRMVELSYSLYECLADLISDTEALANATDEDIEGLVERITLSAMNCHADMVLLFPILTAVRVLRYG